MLSIYVNLVYNNEKILFTVVYVPMAIIESGKMLVLVGLLIMNMLLWLYYAMFIIQYI